MKKLFVLSSTFVLLMVSLLMSSSMAFAEEVQCVGSLGAVTRDNIFVPDGQTCTLNGTRALGTVKVGTGATLYANNVRINGNLQAEGARYVQVRGASTIGGNVQIKQGMSASVSGARINGDLYFDENRGFISASSNIVGSNLQAFQNTGGLSFVGNRIAQNMQCKEDNPAPTGRGNIAGNKEDQCARL